MKVPFNKPYMPLVTIKGSDDLRTLGKNYQSCQRIFETELGFKRVIFTPSCTAALELIALTLDIHAGDEVVLPSYTYVSTANAFALRGAKLVFVDTYHNHPTADLAEIEKAITSKTKAIVIVHYGGFAINYAKIKKLKKKYGIPVIEDAAHCLGSTAEGSHIGKIGDFSAFSFHETKNISCGQGGAVVVNNKKYWSKSNMISQCGTDKIEFIQGKVKFYSWKVVGSNYLLAEPLCAILLASLKERDVVNARRMFLWKEYHRLLKPLVEVKNIQLPPAVEGGNGHIFYILTNNQRTRDALIRYLKTKDIEATFHYSPLHLSDNKIVQTNRPKLKNTKIFGECLVRLPLFYELTDRQQKWVVKSIIQFYHDFK
jgi:dTDP-4-amino-4,6-dideoxygalactose transaminase